MMNRNEARTFLATGLGSVGIRGRRYTWQWVGEGVRWLIYLDRPPYGHRVAVDVGCSMDAHWHPVSRVGECPIIAGVGNMTLGLSVNIAELFDFESNIKDHDRGPAIALLGAALGQYVQARSTPESVQAAYDRDEFVSAFIHRTVRAMLDDGRWGRQRVDLNE